MRRSFSLSTLCFHEISPLTLQSVSAKLSYTPSDFSAFAIGVWTKKKKNPGNLEGYTCLLPD